MTERAFFTEAADFAIAYIETLDNTNSLEAAHAVALNGEIHSAICKCLSCGLHHVLIRKAYEAETRAKALALASWKRWMESQRVTA